MFTKDTFAAYLAAFIDGEGCIDFNKIVKGAVYPGLLISNTHQGVLEFIARKTGHGHVAIKKTYPGRKQQWIWQLQNAEAVSEVLQLALPYLIIKQSLAISAIKICKQRIQTRSNQRNATFQRNTDILRKLSEGQRGSVLAREYGISHQLISNFKTGIRNP